MPEVSFGLEAGLGGGTMVPTERGVVGLAGKGKKRIWRKSLVYSNPYIKTFYYRGTLRGVKAHFPKFLNTYIIIDICWNTGNLANKLFLS